VRSNIRNRAFSKMQLRSTGKSLLLKEMSSGRIVQQLNLPNDIFVAQMFSSPVN